MLKMEVSSPQLLPALLPAKIFGLDAEGKPFFQRATVRSPSGDSALLDGVEHHLKPGDILGLQCEERKARVRVLWASAVKGTETMQVGVQLLAAQKCPWLGAVEAETHIVKAGGRERRKNPRYKISIGLEIRDESNHAKMQVRTTDMSVGGCYIETFLPLKIGTKLSVEMWVNTDKITISAVVRTSDPGVGMGIEFLDLNCEEELHLERLLRSRFC